ncbi:MAG: DotI/IcmL/TraM family protein, partial [Deltaproteobacteria bacterium]|nr:DotI/IcmL/TraM family protein [Deltaproteobacteria bacterium]
MTKGNINSKPASADERIAQATGKPAAKATRTSKVAKALTRPTRPAEAQDAKPAAGNASAAEAHEDRPDAGGASAAEAHEDRPDAGGAEAHADSPAARDAGAAAEANEDRPDAGGAEAHAVSPAAKDSSATAEADADRPDAGASSLAPRATSRVRTPFALEDFIKGFQLFVKFIMNEQLHPSESSRRPPSENNDRPGTRDDDSALSETSLRRSVPNEDAEREAPEREATEREAPEREATEREAPEREATEREAPEREATERESPEREATEREASEPEREAEPPRSPPKSDAAAAKPRGRKPRAISPTASCSKTTGSRAPEKPEADSGPASAMPVNPGSDITPGAADHDASSIASFGAADSGTPLPSPEPSNVPGTRKAAAEDAARDSGDECRTPAPNAPYEAPDSPVPAYADDADRKAIPDGSGDGDSRYPADSRSVTGDGKRPPERPPGSDLPGLDRVMLNLEVSRRTNRFLSVSLVAALGVIACLAAGLTYFLAADRDRYFALSEDAMRVVEMRRAEEPPPNQQALLNWMADTVIRSLSLDFLNWRRQLNDVRNEFDP